MLSIKYNSNDPLYDIHGPIYETTDSIGERCWVVVDLFGLVIPEGEA